MTRMRSDPLLVALLLFGLVSALHTAEVPPAIQWQRSFGGTNDDWLYVVERTPDGGFVLGGSSMSGVSGNKSSPGYGKTDFWLIKVDAFGNKLWENSFGGTEHDELLCLFQTRDGGFILGGYSTSPISGNKTSPNYGDRDYWVVKVDSTGRKVWERAFGGVGEDQLFSVSQTADGGYLLAGSAFSGISGNKTNAGFGSLDLWLVKLDQDGNKLREKSFGGASAEYGGRCVSTTDGGYILGSRSYSGISGNKSSGNFGSLDYWVIKIDANWDTLWDQSFGGTDADELWSVLQTSDGGFILSGSSQSFVSGNKTSENFYGQFGQSPDYWVIKLDSSGNKIWDRSFGGESNDALFTAQETRGGYLLGGSSASGIAGNKTSPNLGASGSWDVWLIKVDQNGSKVWEAPFGGNDSDILSTLGLLDNGYIFGASSMSAISGNKTAPNYGGSDFWIVKLEGPPTISAQPESQSVAVGDPVTFAVAANGASPLIYQWLFNNSPIRGASAATLSLLNTTYAQAGFYSIIVSNQFGSVTSVRAELSFKFLSLRMYAGLTIDGQQGQNYRIEYVDALRPTTTWQSLTTVTLTNTPYLYIDTDSVNFPQRFYRALPLP